MGDKVFSRAAFTSVRAKATDGGRRSATHQAEERARKHEGMNPLVDPKGLPHLGPIRRSLPRFDKKGDLWVLTCGVPMAEETLLDTTGSMGDNVDRAFESLVHTYEMMTGGKQPVLGKYDVQIATSNFNDVQDGDGVPVLCRSQFEMAEKIAQQMTFLVPGRNGCGNGKEDSQFGLFAAAYLTAARINDYGLKWYHFTVSDEPIVPTVDLGWLKRIFGDDILERIKENGYNFGVRSIPDTEQVVSDLQKKAHAFFLQVHDRDDVKRQWTDLYGADHFVRLPQGTTYLHCVKAAIIGLTEGVLDLSMAESFLRANKMDAEEAKQTMRALAHIPLGAHAKADNFGRLPKAGDLFKSKTDLWPVSGDEVKITGKPGKPGKPGGAQWL